MSSDNGFDELKDGKANFLSFLERNHRLAERVRHRDMLRRTPDVHGRDDENIRARNAAPELVLFPLSSPGPAARRARTFDSQTSPSAPVPTGYTGNTFVRRSAEGPETGSQEHPEANHASRNNTESKTVETQKIADMVYLLMRRDLVRERERSPRLEVR